MPTISTTLALKPGPALESLAERARALNAQVESNERSVTIQGATTHIEAKANVGTISIMLRTDSNDELQKIRGLLDGFAKASGIATVHWQGAAPQKAKLIMAHAVSRTQISPSFKRIRLAGDFSGFRTGGLHFRLLIAPDNVGWPEPGPEGDLIWPGGIDAWHRPPYTIRTMSPDADWLDVDIFVHDGGRVTEWAEDLRPGDQVVLTGPGGRGIRPAGWLGLAGDETALPVIIRALEAAGPATQGHAMILIKDSADIQPVDLSAGLCLDWVLRNEGRSLIDLFRSLPAPPETDRFMFFAGERQEAAMAREHAKSLGLITGEYHCAAYWTEGWVPPASQRQARRRAAMPG